MANLPAITLFDRIKTAYDCSTPNNNLYKALLDSINWDYGYYCDEDEEYGFLKGDLALYTPSLNPFEMGEGRKPSVMFSDMSQVYF